MRRLATVRIDGGTRAALVGDGSAELLEHEDVRGALQAVESGAPLARAGELGIDEVDFAPLVVRPDKVVCVGLNYYGHAAEAGLPIPAHPLLFPKYPSALIGARDDIMIPPETEKPDWEAELAFVVGRTARRLSPEEAWSAIAGYTVMNDITMRDWQKHTSQMMPGKTFECSTPLGPWLVEPQEIDNGRDLRISCRVDGEVRQDARTSDMIFDAGTVLSYISHVLTVRPGDVVALGTPTGVGSVRTPPLFLEAGQVVTTEIEGVGELRNLCVAEDPVGR
jgi:acylpyruvate hydrolase